LDIAALKMAASGHVDTQRALLCELATKIHDNPELGFHEEQAVSWLTECLEEAGFTVQRGIKGVPTAFRADYGEGSPVIGLIAEYDALPGVGHACGHNLSCSMSVGAALALRQVVDEAGGRVSVIGTPAEELFGGKVKMARQGAFDDLDAAMMVHSATVNCATTYALACQNLDVEFFGRSAHAAARPEEGINALEAMLLSFAGINSLRQHIKSSARVHGIITDGGQSPNIVPDHSAGKFLVRAEKDDYLDELKERVLECFKGAAAATGARLQYEWDDLRYTPMRNNLTIARLFAANMQKVGRAVQMVDSAGAFGSTDMGNVSQIVPSIHATVAIAPAGVLLHSPEFAEAAVSETAFDGMCDAAKTLAMTAIDLLATPETMAEAKEEFGAGK
jgi:amidohydrolase